MNISFCQDFYASNVGNHFSLKLLLDLDDIEIAYCKNLSMSTLNNFVYLCPVVKVIMALRLDFINPFNSPGICTQKELNVKL